VVVGRNQAAVEKVLHLLSYFFRCGNSAYYDITTAQGGDELERLAELDEPAREVNVFELGVDPVAEFSAVMAAASVAQGKAAVSDEGSGRRKTNRPNK
jgi:hypothetical protein